MPKVELGEREVEEARVIEWRMQWLIYAGFSKDNAAKIANSKVDYRFAIETRNNCLRRGYDESFVMKLIL